MTCSLISILACIRLNMWLGAGISHILIFFLLCFVYLKTFKSPLVFLLCYRFKHIIWLDFQTHSIPQTPPDFNQRFCMIQISDKWLKLIHRTPHLSVCWSTDFKNWYLAIKKITKEKTKFVWLFCKSSQLDPLNLIGFDSSCSLLSCLLMLFMLQ